MALATLRCLLKSGPIMNEGIIFNSRSIVMANVRRSKTQEENKTQSTAGEASPPPPEGINAASNSEIEKLNKEISVLTEKNKDVLDKYKRALADGENLRNRLMKQISEAKIYGIQSFCKDLLDVADVLGKATETVPKEEISDKNPHLKSLYEGLMMTEQQLKSVFKRHGLEAFNPLNEKFDPNCHEALFQQEAKDKQPGTVTAVQKIGYKLHDRVIRPALVGVAK